MLGPRGYWNKKINGKGPVVNIAVRMPQLVVVYERRRGKKEGGQEETRGKDLHDATEQTTNF